MLGKPLTSKEIAEKVIFYCKTCEKYMPETPSKNLNKTTAQNYASSLKENGLGQQFITECKTCFENKFTIPTENIMQTLTELKKEYIQQ